VIDLHCHTTVSDGGDSPTELVEKAAAANLKAIAVTDHDNDSGCDEAVAAGERLGVEVIRGVEISCDVDDLTQRGLEPSRRPTMHLLGYFIPDTSNPLSEGLAQLQHDRANRNQRMVERLNELGVDVTFEEVETEAGGPGAQIGRPHFANVMVRKGIVSDFQTAFDEYLAKGAKAYLGRKLYTPIEAIELMTGSGVVPVLAHPFTLFLEEPELDRFVTDLIEAGLQGIEGYHGDLSLDEQQPMRELGKRHALVVTGGSDYHGAMVPDRTLPGGKSGVVVPDEVLDALKDVVSALRSW
jgi:predicted metal-dependent phosphoesterase TrpH